MINPEQNPYVGARTFEPEEKDLFFGREREAFDLLSLVISDRLVLFYAQSGAGKSSLINTRLIPGLLDEGEFQVFPVGRLRRDEVPVDSAKNIYIYNLLTSLSKTRMDESVLANLSFSDYLRHTQFTEKNGYFYDGELDENVFTHGNRDPYKYVLIIDQFEELFTTHDEKWKSREDFFNQLAAAMNDFPRLWIVLVMREDYIANLDPYISTVPGGFRTRYYMQRLSIDRAIEAVEGPVRKRNRSYGVGAARTLVDALSQVIVRGPDNQDVTRSGQYVEPVQLQVVCSSLWEKIKDTEGEISNALVLEHVAKINQALGNFYEQRVQEVAIGEIAREKRVKERDIRTWFEKELIIDGKKRNMVAQQAGGKSGGLDDKVVQEFVRNGLVREEKRGGGTTFYELTHDRMVEPILENNRKWDIENSSPFRSHVDEWEKYKRERETDLLSDGALIQALGWANENPEKMTKNEAEYLEACQVNQRRLDDEREKTLQEQRMQQERELQMQREEQERQFQQQELEAARQLAEVQTRSAKRARLFSIIAFGLVVISILGFFFAFTQARVATTSSYSAATQRAVAERQEDLAKSNAVTAQAASILAVANQQSALSNLLAAQSASLLDKNFQIAMLLGVESYRTSQTLETRSALLNTALSNPQLSQYLKGQTSAVLSVGISPDGRYVISGSSDGTAHVWDVMTGKELAHIIHDGVVTSVDFSPDGRYVISGSSDGTARVWAASTGTEVARMVHDGAVTSVTFSPDGRYVASGSDDQTARVWEALSGREVTRVTFPDLLTSVAFSPDGRTLASSIYDRTIILWNVAKGQPIGEPLVGHKDAVTSVVFSPDGKTLASGSCSNRSDDQCKEGEIILWNVETGETIGEPLKGHTDAVTSVAFSPDGKTLASGSSDSKIILWTVEDQPPVGQPLSGHTDAVTSVTFSQDGKTLVSGSDDQNIILWDVAKVQTIGQPLSGHTDAVTSVAFSPDGKTLASGSADTTIILWDMVEGQRSDKPWGEHQDTVTSVAFSPDGKTLASGSADSTIILWDLRKGQPIGKPLSGHDGWVNSVAFSPDGKTLASGSDDTTIILWDLESRQPSGEPLIGHNDWVNSVAFSPDGKLLASGSADNTIILWDLESRRPQGEPLIGHNDWVNSVAFSPDGKLLASGSADNTIILWDVESLQPIGSPLKGHSDLVTSVAFSPDGTTLASGSYDQTIILWDVEKRLLIGQPLKGHVGPVSSVAFNPDGQNIVSGSYDQSIIVWSLNPQSWIEKACQRAGRNFTLSEWVQYFSNEEYRKTCEQWPSDSTVVATPVETLMATTATPHATITLTATTPITPGALFVTPTPVLFQVVNVTAPDKLNIRTGAGYKYNIVGKIPADGRGIQVTGEGVQADSAIWVPVIYEGISGWVNSFYITQQNGP